ncbi:MAG: InlB B-repeat-containing protein, partial [Actinomycetota bacterium]
HGYPLWIAHWGVSSPAVPADDWGGAGWTFWQWTSTGHVAGIDPNVDRDRFNGSNLVAGEIASLTVSPAAGGTVAGDRIDCGGGASDCSRLANPGDDLTLTAHPAPDATLLGWTGPCASAGTSPTCVVNAFGARTVAAVFGYTVEVALTGTGLGTVVSTPAGLDCSAQSCSSAFPAGRDVTLTATPDSASGFVSWGGACSGSVATCTVTVNGPRSMTARFDATQQLEQDGAGTGFAWGTRSDPGSLGGSYRWEHRKGATASLTFTGSSVKLYTMGGPAFGRARLSIDGVPVDTIDGYARRPGARTVHQLDGLGTGTHVLTVTVLGTARPKATGTRVGVDAIRAGGELHENPRPSPSTWATVADASASGGTVATSDVAGAAATLRFTGTGVTLRTVRGRSMGRAELWVDGVLARTLDLSAASTVYGVQRTVTGLADGPHVVRLVALGERGESGRGTAVAVDGWVIR